jgi:hypothetical protein
MNKETSYSSAANDGMVRTSFLYHGHLVPNHLDPIPNHHGIVISVIPDGDGSIDNGCFLVLCPLPFVGLYVMTE